MSKTAHRIFIITLVLLTIAVFIWLVYLGSSYYNVKLSERYFHQDHIDLKPSGIYGHGFGIIGSLLILIGVFSYMVRKRYRALHRLGKVTHWLEFHIFLCTLGPILILFHTSFKFGGLVAISFWSMVAVFISGIIGRFIYLQIPRSIEGRELSLSEVREMRREIEELIRNSSNVDDQAIRMVADTSKAIKEADNKSRVFSVFQSYFRDRKEMGRIKKSLRDQGIDKKQRKQIISLVRKDLSLNRRIRRMTMMKNLFKYWHVAHLPFAFVMLIIMLIHVGVTIVFGYKWIF